MVDPMLARLAGCLVFASLFGGLLVVSTKPDDQPRRDQVKVAELQRAVEAILLTRQ